MDTPTTQPFAILICFDDTAASGYAFEEGARLAQRIPGSELHLVDVTTGDPSVPKTRQLAGQLSAYVDAKAASMGGLAGRRVTIHVRHGDPVAAISQLAAEIDIGVIVVGSPKHLHLRSLLPGSLSEGLLTHAPCPVIIVGPKPKEPRVHPATIEPPCPDCVRARVGSHGAQWWCARHTSHGPYGTPAHIYSYQRELPFATHDSAVSPTGVDF